VIQVARGRLSKQIAFDIDIAEATVKVHRSRLMHKMKARSRPELSRIAGKLKLVPGGRNTPEPDASFFLRLARETARCAVLMVRRLIYNVLSSSRSTPPSLEAGQTQRAFSLRLVNQRSAQRNNRTISHDRRVIDRGIPTDCSAILRQPAAGWRSNFEWGIRSSGRIEGVKSALPGFAQAQANSPVAAATSATIAFPKRFLPKDRWRRRSKGPSALGLYL
jgi:hypothetical protein